MRYPTDERRHTAVATDATVQLSPTSTVQEETTRNVGRTTEVSNNSTADSSCSTMISVLIVDDHALMREGLRQLFSLEDDIKVVGDAVDGFEAMEKIRQLHPHIVLMDINLPVVDGIAITRQISHQYPEIAVVMLTMHRQNQQIVDALKNGARGYLLKNTSARELAQAIRNVKEGEVAITPGLTGALVNELRRQPESGTNSQDIAQLSEKEIEIIRFLAAGMSNKEIAEQLAYSEKTVKNYLSIIFQKLHLRDRTQVAIFALRQGLLPEQDVE